MRYSEDHKARTHEKIVDEAARRFRRDGVGATGLQPLMKALGLTHGGFYAHFKSKGELVESALRRAADQLKDASARAFESDRPLKAFITGYLSSSHRNEPGEGCPLPTMSAELGQRGESSATTDQLILNRLAAIENNMVGDASKDESVLLLSAAVGALVLSRSAHDPELSDRLLKTTRRLLIERYDPDDTAS
ncbi:TetR/AcrR family transcriptional regulator [Marinobacter sp. V034]|uniref:TetR/AcrR family transcriptional regulator n=1 Tax=Marinobacter sp. V034 TaxID=3459610 RepID=UPI004044AF61